MRVERTGTRVPTAAMGAREQGFFVSGGAARCSAQAKADDIGGRDHRLITM